jgi:hypothetical protein
LPQFLPDGAQQIMPTGLAEPAGRGVILLRRERLRLGFRRRSAALALQLFDSPADHRKIVGGAGAGHASSVQLLLSSPAGQALLTIQHAEGEENR